MPAVQDKGKRKRQSIDFQSLSSVRLQERVDEDIRNVANVLGVEVWAYHHLVHYF